MRWIDRAGAETSFTRVAAREKPFFTPEEVSHIDSAMHQLVFNWPEWIVWHVIAAAKQAGVKRLYWNTSDTQEGSHTESKIGYFYETLPKRMGFVRTEANLRGKGPEPMWTMDIGTAKTAAANMTPLDRINPKYQGAFIGILKHRGPYTPEEVEKVRAFVTDKKERPIGKQHPLSYLSHQRLEEDWTGGQRFHPKVNEMVFVQRMSKSIYEQAAKDPVLAKFLSFLLSQPGHFGNDATGFVLVSPLKKDTWVINEVQTDNVNRYLDVRNEVTGRSGHGSNELDEQTVFDMLEAQGKSKWVEYLRGRPQVMEHLRHNPGEIAGLADDRTVEAAGGVEAWVREQGRHLEAFRGMGQPAMQEA